MHLVAALRSSETDDENGTFMHPFVLALFSLPDPVPTLQRYVRDYDSGKGALFWVYSVRTERPLCAECFERLTTDQLLALFGPLVEENPALRYTANRCGDCLLHQAVRSGVDLPVFQMLSSPELELRKDHHQTTLLHMACSLSNRPVVGYLLERHPDMARELDNSGNYPLHKACGSHVSQDVRLVRRLMDLHPLALRKRNRYVQTPITITVRQRRDLLARDARWNALCVRMLQLEPDAVRVLPQVRPRKYPTPLGHACQFVRAQNFVHLLIRVWPVAVGFAGKGLLVRCKTLPFEDLRCNDVSTTQTGDEGGVVTSLPSTTTLPLVHLVDSATRRLLRALVELAWHETARPDVVAAVRVPLAQIF